MKIAILGFAGQGQSAFEYWNKDGNELTICDKDETTEVPESATKQLGQDYLKNLDRFELLIRTPALHPREIINANSSQILDKVWSNTNEFLKVCPTKNIIGVTGTKGKGTTSTLIARMLESAGKRVHLGGNIGTPPLDLLKDGISSDDWVVLELANFQLIDLKLSPPLAACLMVVPEHMDWHEDFEEYIAAKQQLFIHQAENDTAVYYAQNEESVSVADASPGKKIPYMERPGAVVEGDAIKIDDQIIVSVSDVKLLGKHNLQNICAAVTVVWQVAQDVEAISSVIKSFSGLEHRLELVREFEGVKYYDDSFGTTPETAVVAIEAFEQPKVVILGGSDKGASYDQLAKKVVSENVKHVVAIGQTADAIMDAIDTLKDERRVESTRLGEKSTMDEIVKTAREHAAAGDVVLLSTGCASFGMFKNYKDRAEQFKKAVEVLV